MTLTTPHHERDTIRGRIDLVLAAWSYFLRRFNEWGRATGGAIEVVRVLEWTPGDGYGYCFREHRVDAPLMASGSGVMVGSVTVGTILGTRPDEAHLSIEPLRRDGPSAADGASTTFVPGRRSPA